VSITIVRRSRFNVIAYCAWKERVHVSIYSAMYLSNSVAFVGSGYVVRRQYKVRCFTLKQILPEFLEQFKSGVQPLSL
jgi:hypothetical protein